MKYTWWKDNIKIQKKLKKLMKHDEQLEEDKADLFNLKICCILVSITNFGFLGLDTIQGKIKNSSILMVYFMMNVFIVGLIIFSHIK